MTLRLWCVPNALPVLPLSGGSTSQLAVAILASASRVYRYYFPLSNIMRL